MIGIGGGGWWVAAPLLRRLLGYPIGGAGRRRTGVVRRNTAPEPRRDGAAARDSPVRAIGCVARGQVDESEIGMQEGHI